MESSMEIPQKTRIELPCDPVTPLLGTYPKECKTGYCRDICTEVHCSTIHNSQALETTQCPTTHEWIKKMWYIYTTEYYSATRNGV
jgi:hypothetical protein